MVICVALVCAQILVANTPRLKDADGSRESVKRGSDASSALQERRPKSPEAQAAFDVGYSFYEQALLYDKPEDWDGAIEAFTKAYRLEPTWTPIFYSLAAANLGTEKMFLTAVAWGWAYLYANPKGEYAKGAREIVENGIRKAEEKRIKIFAIARTLVEKVPKDDWTLYALSDWARNQEEDCPPSTHLPGKDYYHSVLGAIRYLQAKAGDFDAVIEEVKENLTKYFADYTNQPLAKASQWGNEMPKCKSCCWGAFFNTCLEVKDWEGAELALSWDYGSLDIPGKSGDFLRGYEDSGCKGDFYSDKWDQLHKAFSRYWDQVRTLPDIVQAWARLALQFHQDEREFRIEEDLKQLTNKAANEQGDPKELPVKVAYLVVPYGKALRRIRGLDRISERVLLQRVIGGFGENEELKWDTDLAKTKAAFRDNPDLFRLRELKDSTALHTAAMGYTPGSGRLNGENFTDSGPLEHANDWNGWHPGSYYSREDWLKGVPLVKEFVGFLLANGADVNAKMISGQTPLHLAAVGNSGEAQAIEIVGLLLAKGAEVNVRTTDICMTPLHFAACMGMLRVVKLLLDHGADVRAVNLTGRTPLHLAAFWGRMDVAKALVSAGADLSAEDKYGFTAAEIASKKGFADLAAFLRSR